MYTIKSVSYQKSRLEFFEKQYASSIRKMDWAVKHKNNPDTIMDRADTVNYYKDAVAWARLEVDERDKDNG